MKPSISIVALLSAMSTSLVAKPIETILVTGSKTPITTSQFSGAVDIIDATTIKASQATTLSELLRGFGGIAISQSGGDGALSEIRMRGSESNHTIIMVNGVPINDLGQGDLANLAHIAINTIERIEIIKGGQSALWGSGAIGGVINIITAQGEATESKITLSTGNNANRLVSFNRQQTLGKSQFSVGLQYRSTDGENISMSGDEDDGYDNLNLATAGQYQLSGNDTLSFSLNVSDAENHFDSDSDFDGKPNDTDEFTQVKQHQALIKWQHDAESMKHIVTLAQNKQENTTYNGDSFNGEASSDIQTLSWLVHTPLKDNSHLNLQIEYQKQDFANRAPVVWGDPNQQRSNNIASGIVDSIIALKKDWNLTLSGRLDSNEIYKDSNSYNLGSNYRLNDSVRFFTSYSKAVKNPTFTETYGYTPASFIGNPNLTPETAKTFEIGSSIEWQGWDFDISFYDSQLNDEIVTLFLPTFESTTENLDSDSKRKGAEVSISGDWQGWNITTRYGYNSASQAGEDEKRRPQNTGQVQLQKDFMDDALSFFLQASYQSKQLDTDFGPFPALDVTLPGYTLLNSTVSYQVTDKLTGFFKATNIGDKQYQDVFGYRGLGRQFSLGFSYNL